MISIEEIFKLCSDEFESVQKIRRDIHAHPEIGFEVQRTAEIVSQELNDIGLEVSTGVGQTGVIGNLHGGAGDSSFLALRADMDALPMHQNSKLSYASKVAGRAHMCGHDAHTAMLIGAARILSRLKWQLPTSVRFIFQPNEENLPGGAPAMIKDGALDNVREIYGLHVWPPIPTGSYGYCPGPAMAMPETFDLKIVGKGGHAGLPHLTQEALLAGVRWVDTIQSIVARNVDSMENAVLSVTQFHGGSAHNVIAGEVKIQGTIRTLNATVSDQIWARMQAITEGLSKAFSVQMELTKERGYPVLINSESQQSYVESVLSGLLKSTDHQVVPWKMKSIMGAEDFAYYLQEKPGAFIFLGSNNGKSNTSFMCHHPKFEIDESCMVHGMALHVGLALGKSARS